MSNHTDTEGEEEGTYEIIDDTGLEGQRRSDRCVFECKNQHEPPSKVKTDHEKKIGRRKAVQSKTHCVEHRAVNQTSWSLVPNIRSHLVQEVYLEHLRLQDGLWGRKLQKHVAELLSVRPRVQSAANLSNRLYRKVQRFHSHPRHSY